MVVHPINKLISIFHSSPGPGKHLIIPENSEANVGDTGQREGQAQREVSQVYNTTIAIEDAQATMHITIYVTLRDVPSFVK